MGWYYGGYGFRPYVSVAKRRAKAAKEAERFAKKGRVCCPIKIEGRKIANTFWGKAWCDHLEQFSDFSNRLPRGRTYARNGSILDLQIEPGEVKALVMGSRLYEVKIDVSPLAAELWKKVKCQCGGQIASLVELLQGRLSTSVMEIVTQRDRGLFPLPKQIKLDCSCPDYASMCKHVAAVLYGVGARLDQQPELLFKLRGVDHLELIAGASDVTQLDKGSSSRRKTIAADALSEVFGIDLASAPPPPDAREQRSPSSKATRRSKPDVIDEPRKTRERPPAARKREPLIPRRKAKGT
ncbi:MAG TPA: SWIM zinc finger family protein [Tepidisphaeraceae bacterium]|nr:SWIM zinc finger family protein [Tepidisphaeraceae bacterium]